ncbi:hypothetical protein G6F52_013896 [Rhizopus delemar]|nr:hypothetical protein G6F52_013896 [Rhizopus delemar]
MAQAQRQQFAHAGDLAGAQHQGGDAGLLSPIKRFDEQHAGAGALALAAGLHLRGQRRIVQQIAALQVTDPQRHRRLQRLQHPARTAGGRWWYHVPATADRQ